MASNLSWKRRGSPQLPSPQLLHGRQASDQTQPQGNRAGLTPRLSAWRRVCRGDSSKDRWTADVPG